MKNKMEITQKDFKKNLKLAWEIGKNDAYETYIDEWIEAVVEHIRELKQSLEAKK